MSGEAKTLKEYFDEIYEENHNTNYFIFPFLEVLSSSKIQKGKFVWMNRQFQNDKKYLKTLEDLRIPIDNNLFIEEEFERLYNEKLENHKGNSSHRISQRITGNMPWLRDYIDFKTKNIDKLDSGGEGAHKPIYKIKDDKIEEVKEFVRKYKEEKEKDIMALIEAHKKKPEDEKEQTSNPGKSSNQTHGNDSKTNTSQPLNQILYGPPGTGKTYDTINKAIEIIDPDFFQKNSKDTPENHKNLRDKFNEYKKAGQIEFVTFHQSYGYEEFVEGIKPVMDGDDNEQVKYEICDGVFKRLCKNAEEKDSFKNFDDAIQKFKDDIDKKGDEGILLNTLRDKKFTVTSYNENVFHAKPKEGQGTHPANITKIKEFYEKGKASMTNHSYGWGIFEYLKSKYNLGEYEQDNNKKNYVLIIDEINRGNISKIFGELITLIEKSKRIGAEDELKVTLPYSGDKDFGVPANLYIIGTMNTADRSIALMDIALRRRFQFVEMMPNADLLNNLIVEGINIRTMFEKINERIEYLMDRDHQIGHSFFMPLIGIEKEEKYKKLQEIFYYELIPLLQEYFYEDWEKIQIILGDHPKQKSKEGKDELRFIIGEKKEEKSVIGFDHDDIENDKVIYKINSSLKEYKMNEQAFIKIYDKIEIIK